MLCFYHYMYHFITICYVVLLQSVDVQHVLYKRTTTCIPERYLRKVLQLKRNTILVLVSSNLVYTTCEEIEMYISFLQVCRVDHCCCPFILPSLHCYRFTAAASVTPVKSIRFRMGKMSPQSAFLLPPTHGINTFI